MIKTGNRNFWIAQILGWGIFALANFILQSNVEGFGKQAVINSAIIFFGGIGITTAYRYFIKSLDLNLLLFRNAILTIFGGTIVLVVAFLLLVSLIMFILHDGQLLSVVEVLSNAFLFSILMLIWNSLYFIVHYLHSWKDSESEKWQLAAAVKEAQLGNLKAQINPHFMFNAINNIRALISENPNKAKEMLLNFSDMFRYSLIHSDQSLVTLKQELEIVKKYLELLTIQFEGKLDYSITVDPKLVENMVPPMMIQLLVENAIKHGLSKQAEGGKVEIYVLSEKDYYIIRVINTGSFEATPNVEKKLGVGLKNIRERLNLIYGSSTNLTLIEENGLVKAEIKIPSHRLNPTL